MSQVHAITAWPTSRIEEELFALLVAVQYLVELSATNAWPMSNLS